MKVDLHDRARHGRQYAALDTLSRSVGHDGLTGRCLLLQPRAVRGLLERTQSEVRSAWRLATVAAASYMKADRPSGALPALRRLTRQVGDHEIIAVDRRPDLVVQAYVPTP